jgi:hypothetical protein
LFPRSEHSTIKKPFGKDSKALYFEKSDSIAVSKDILRFSSMPGTYRHHWRTDMDLVSVDPVYFDNEVGKKTYDWLVLHAGE